MLALSNLLPEDSSEAVPETSSEPPKELIFKHINNKNSEPIIELPVHTTIHISTEGKVFHLTPIGGNKLEHYSAKLNDYEKENLKIEFKMFYDSKGHLITREKKYDHSLATQMKEFTARTHKISLWIQACYFVIIKSEQGRYWFLHYTGESASNRNYYKDFFYPRPSYSDLDPILPYNINNVNLEKNEKVDVFVVQPGWTYDLNDSENLDNRNFDAEVFREIIGPQRVKSIEYICFNEFKKERGEQQFDIEFDTEGDQLTLRKWKESTIVYAQKDIFNSPVPHAAIDPDLLTKKRKP